MKGVIVWYAAAASQLERRRELQTAARIHENPTRSLSVFDDNDHEIARFAGGAWTRCEPQGLGLVPQFPGSDGEPPPDGLRG